MIEFYSLSSGGWKILEFVSPSWFHKRAIFSLCAYMIDEARDFFGAFFIKALILFESAEPS
jgi:hypothetical protein